MSKRSTASAIALAIASCLALPLGASAAPGGMESHEAPGPDAGQVKGTDVSEVPLYTTAQIKQVEQDAKAGNMKAAQAIIDHPAEPRQPL